MTNGFRPTDFSEEILWKTRAYINGGYQLLGALIPTKEGLSLHLGVSRQALHNWTHEASKGPYSPELKQLLEELMASQAEMLLTNGLAGRYNSTIAKLVLTKHGYTDKVEQKVDATVQVQEIEIVFRH